MMRVVQRGMTLIELMVAMVIGLGVTLAITSLLITGENHKRTTTSTNDAEQTGAYGFHALDGVLRGAGSAFAQSAYSPDVGVLGCLLNVGGILPRTTPFPAPFATSFLSGATASLRVAPLLIAYNQSDSTPNPSDVLVVMGGSGAAGGVSRQLTGGGSTTQLVLDNTVGFAVNDVGLLTQPGITDCLLEEVAAPLTAGSSTLNLAATAYKTTTGTTTSLATLAASTSSYFTPLGNAGINNLQFELIGVGADRTLYSYDLLQNLNLIQATGADVSQAIADGVDQLHAIYGVDLNNDGVPDTWKSPAPGSGWDIATVMANPALMKQILSVRVALVVRGQYYDKNAVSPPTLTLFGGLTDSSGNPLPALQQTVALSANDQHYRYRVFEFTVPLRNMLLLARGGT
jgi:type IV pilus assembly protein PilW